MAVIADVHHPQASGRSGSLPASPSPHHRPAGPDATGWWHEVSSDASFGHLRSFRPDISSSCRSAPLRMRLLGHRLRGAAGQCHDGQRRRPADDSQSGQPDCWAPTDRGSARRAGAEHQAWSRPPGHRQPPSLLGDRRADRRPSNAVARHNGRLRAGHCHAERVPEVLPVIRQVLPGHRSELRAALLNCCLEPEPLPPQAATIAPAAAARPAPPAGGAAIPTSSDLDAPATRTVLEDRATGRLVAQPAPQPSQPHGYRTNP
jgi:hypothetical protein